MNDQKISEAVIRRLPQYDRYLRELERLGITRISSGELGKRMGLTASQIRQDINCFGALGQQGYGYNVQELKSYIEQILGLSEPHDMVIVGAGNLGRAVCNYPGFLRRGITPVALFDRNESLKGIKVGELTVQSMEEFIPFLKENPASIGVIATPRQAAQEVADLMVEGGVRAIWNFAPVDLKLPPDVAVNNVHLTDSLLVLTYRLRVISDRKNGEP